MYGDLLGKLGGASGVPPAAHGLGMGAPPKMPGAMPPPTGVGAIPSPLGGTDKKLAADEAILKLRDAMSHFPALAPKLTETIDALKAAASGSAPPTAGAPPPPAQGLGAPSAPGTPPPPVPGPDVSGSPGPL